MSRTAYIKNTNKNRMVTKIFEWIQNKCLLNFKEADNDELYFDLFLPKVRVISTRKEPLVFHRLTGVINFIKLYATGDVNCFVVVHDQHHVAFYTEWDGKNNKPVHIADAKFNMRDNYKTNQWYDRKNFIVWVLTSFVPGGERNRLLSLVANLTDENIAVSDDNMISQKVSAKTGVKRIGNEKVENSFSLSMYRTWSEVQQPESNYVLRINNVDGIKIALFDFGGDSWKAVAVKNIYEYLKNNLDVPIY